MLLGCRFAKHERGKELELRGGGVNRLVVIKTKLFFSTHRSFQKICISDSEKKKWMDGLGEVLEIL